MKKIRNIKSIGCAFAAAAIIVSNTQAGEPVVMPEVVEPSCPWSIGLEALYLKAHENEGDYNSQDYEFAYRLEASYQFQDSVGLRLRYFDFEGTDYSYNDHDKGGDDFGNPQMSAFDIEVFDGFELGSWNGEFSAGIRFGTFEETYEKSTYTDFEGWGPTLGLELTRPLAGNFSIYAGVRGSWLFGDSDSDHDRDYDADSSIFIAEGSLGLQYDFQAFSSCSSYVRLGMEAQNWLSASDFDNEDIALFGGSLKVGFNF